jgi:hypothetical protein
LFADLGQDLTHIARRAVRAAAVVGRHRWDALRVQRRPGANIGARACKGLVDGNSKLALECILASSRKLTEAYAHAAPLSEERFSDALGFVYRWRIIGASRIVIVQCESVAARLLLDNRSVSRPERPDVLRRNRKNALLNERCQSGRCKRAHSPVANLNAAQPNMPQTTPNIARQIGTIRPPDSDTRCSECVSHVCQKFTTRARRKNFWTPAIS